MRMTIKMACLGTALMMSGGAWAAPRTISVPNDTLGDVQVVAPAGEPRLFVVTISDADGLTDARRAEAERLVEAGAAVALIDLPDLQRKLSASADENCHYTFGDFEDLTRVAERELGMANWRWPVMLGTGDGGTLAYLALAQAPDNTTAGAVSLGFAAHLATRLPLCAGAPSTRSGDGVHSYEPQTDLPARWRWIAASPPEPDLAKFAGASPMAELRVVPGDANARFAAALQSVTELGAPPDGGLSDLPLIELPAKGKPLALAVFISGDGGWRDLDKQIGDTLQAHDVAVVGVDALRYFWSRKSPEQVAADIGRIMRHYQQLWQVRKTALLGYSFGADILPLAWGKMDAASRDATELIGLIGLDPAANLEVTAASWLGMASPGDIPVAPYLSQMPANKVLCVYGSDEQQKNETACTLPELDKATRLMRPGGHHLDGNYEAVADALLVGLTSPAASVATLAR